MKKFVKVFTNGAWAKLTSSAKLRYMHKYEVEYSTDGRTYIYEKQLMLSESKVKGQPAPLNTCDKGNLELQLTQNQSTQRN